MDLPTFRALLTAPGQRVLSEAEAAYGEGQDPLAAGTRLRRSYPASLVAAAMTQAGLRRTAWVKFGADSEGMYFTANGLEQATHRVVAAHRAARAVATEGVSTVLDLGCGIGSDLTAFAKAGLDTTGVDHDPLTAAVAEANVAALGLPGTVQCADAVQRTARDTDLVFVDPSRRTGGARVFRPEDYSPPWSRVTELLARTGGRTVVKVAPGIDHQRIPAGVEAEWVSLDGGLKEAALWAGLASPYTRRATVLTSDGGSHVLTDADPVDEDVGLAGRYVYEPDDAVTRAHLVTGLAAALGGWRIDPHIALVSADTLRPSPYARCFEVTEELPYQEKRLRSALRARDVGTLTIKPRGVNVVPERLRARLALRGTQEATLLLTRTPNGAVCLRVRPVL